VNAILRLIVTSFAFTVMSINNGMSEEKTLPSAATVWEESEDLCRTFANKAAEAKIARQKKELLDIKSTIDDQLVVLSQKTAQLEAWLKKREEIRSAVSVSLVKMYANVEAEIAAQQLQKLSIEMTSEVLQRLSPKQSGEIIASMDAVFASKIVKNLMTNAAKKTEKTETQ
jgi:flagellar motility protein MotE (MotC chaperone)